jgi:hypothetical protein
MPTRNRFRFTLALALAISFVLGASADARAQGADASAGNEVDPAADARRRYNEGTEAYTLKRFVEAALNFEAAASRRPHAVTLYTAALAWEQSGHAERAADDFARALDVSGLSTAQRTNARDRLATYEAMLGTLVVTGPEGCRVQLDALTEVATPARLHGTPGIRSLAVRTGARAVERRDVLLEVGLTQQLGVDAQAAAVAAPAATANEPGSSARAATPKDASTSVAPKERDVALRARHFNGIRRTVGFVSIGVGVAAVLGGVVLGTQALAARDAFDAAPTRVGFDHANALATWTTVSFVAGGVLAAGGATLVLWPLLDGRTARADVRLTLSPTPGGVDLRGAF